MLRCSVDIFGNRTRQPKTYAHVEVPVLVRIWHEDGVWNASAYDLNVAVFGESLEDAQTNFAQALDSHFELLEEMGRAKATVARLRAAAAEHGFYDRVKPREIVTKFEIPSERELCAA